MLPQLSVGMKEKQDVRKIIASGIQKDRRIIAWHAQQFQIKINAGKAVAFLKAELAVLHAQIS